MHVMCLACVHGHLARLACMVVGWPWLAQQATVIALQLPAVALLPHLAVALLRAPLHRARRLPLRCAGAAAAWLHGEASLQCCCQVRRLLPRARAILTADPRAGLGRGQVKALVWF